MVVSYVFKSRNKKSSSLKRVRAKRSNGLFRLVRNDAMFFYEPALIPPPTSNALLENGPWMKIYGFIVLKKNVWFSIGREICLWCMSSTLNRIRAVCWEAWAVDGSGEAGFLKWKSGSELTIFGHVFFQNRIFSLLPQHVFFRLFSSPFGKYQWFQWSWRNSFETTGNDWFQLEPMELAASRLDFTKLIFI